jgi:sterol desaturase/sphingolipid hydroxylase (fatty acid hydroxylase superfamily)
MLGIPLGLFYANAGEWLIHKYVLHGLGRRKSSMWSYHWQHHRAARKHGFLDPDYARSAFRKNGHGKEALGLLIIALAHLPLLPVAPLFVAAVEYSTLRYYRVHKRAHQDPEWARRHLRWHYDHHMGRNQDANWCVTWPWFDWLMGTRERHVEERHVEERQAEERQAEEGAPSPAG